MYPFFDIDELDKYNHFVKNATCNFVSFQSSPGHFWVIVDKPFDKFHYFKNDELNNDWIVYTDTKYQDMTNRRFEFYIRGFFDKLERQPAILDKVGELSDFIITLTKIFSITIRTITNFNI